MAVTVDQTNARFSYPPLDGHGRQIRLLVLNGITEGSVLSLTLTSVSLEDRPSYIALSYMCGIDSPSQTINVNGTPYKIRANLHEFLHTVASKRFVGEPLFIDAIAINQADLAERSSQVRLMRDVYLQASEVVAWLGSWVLHTDAQMPSGGFQWWNSNLDKAMRLKLSSSGMSAMDLVLTWSKATMSRQDNVGVSLKRKFKEADRETLIYALHAARRPFWTRTWIVQELILARRLEILIGDGSLDPDIVYAMALVYSPSGEARFLTTKTPAPIESATRVHRSAALLSARPTMNAQLRDGRPYRLYQVLIPFGFQRCEEPRDSIFGLLGLVKSHVVADYRLSLTQLYLHVWLEGVMDIVQLTKKEQAAHPQRPHNTDDYDQFIQSFHTACMGAFRCSGLQTTIQLITRTTLQQHGLPGARHLITTFTLTAPRERPWSPLLLYIANIIQYPRVVLLQLFFGKLYLIAYLQYHQILDDWSYQLQGLCLAFMRAFDCEMMMPDGEVRRYSEWVAEADRVARLVQAGIAPEPLERKVAAQRWWPRRLQLSMQRSCLYVVDYGFTLLLALALAWLGVRQGEQWSAKGS